MIRNFLVNPSGAYVDVPWDGPAELGDAVQACNIKSSLGSFSELEYHVPAIGPGRRAAARGRCVAGVGIPGKQGTDRRGAQGPGDHGPVAVGGGRHENELPG